MKAEIDLDKYEMTSLMASSAKGDVHSVLAMLATGVDANARDNRGGTALMYAAMNGHADVVRVLLDVGADPNLKTSKGFAALDFAEQSKSEDITRYLNEAVGRHGSSGVRGWLRFLVITMTTLYPLVTALLMIGEFSIAEHNFPDIVLKHRWGDYKTASWLIFIFASLVSIYGGFRLARSRTRVVVRRAIIILWVTGPIVTLIRGWVLPNIMFADLNGFSLAGGGFTVGYALLWSAYLSYSDRVKNTYRN